MTIRFKLSLGLIFSALLGSGYCEWAPSGSLPVYGNFSDIIGIGDRIIAGNKDGIFFSTIPDTTWTRSNTGFTFQGQPDNPEVYSLYKRGGKLFCGSNRGIYTSTNNGDSWAPSDSALTEVTVFSEIENQLFAYAHNMVYRSTDDGGSWTPTTSPSVFDVRAFTSIDSSFYAAGEHGVFEFVNGNEWKPLPGKWNGDTGDQIDVRAIIAVGKRLVVWREGFGLGIYTIGVADWKVTSGKLQVAKGYDLIRKGPWFFLSTNVGVYATKDLGEYWIDVSAGLPAKKSVDQLKVIGDSVFVSVVTDPGSIYFAPFAEIMPSAGPILLTPEDGATDRQWPLVATWNKSPDASQFRFQLSSEHFPMGLAKSTRSQATPLVIDDTTLTTPSISIDSLKIDTKYFWRVQEKKGAGWSQFSNEWSFTTTNIAPVVSLKTGVNQGWRMNLVGQGGNKFQIGITVPTTGLVGISIHDAMGSKVMKFKKEFRRGIYIIQGDRPSTDMLFCQIEVAGKLRLAKVLRLSN